MTDTPAVLLTAHGFVQQDDRTHPGTLHAARLQATGRFEGVDAGFVNGTPGIEDTVASITSDHVVVVPLFVSDGHFVGSVVPEAVESARPADVSVTYTPPVGTHETVTDIIERRVLSGLGSADSDVGVALYGHGSQQNEANRRVVEDHARRLRQRGLFPEVRSYFVEEDPTGERLPMEFQTESVVIVPVFVASGTHVREDIPAQVGFSGTTDTVDGTAVRYTPPVGADPMVAGIAFERAIEACSDGVTESTDTVRTHKRRQTQ